MGLSIDIYSKDLGSLSFWTLEGSTDVYCSLFCKQGDEREHDFVLACGDKFGFYEGRACRSSSASNLKELNKEARLFLRNYISKNPYKVQRIRKALLKGG